MYKPIFHTFILEAVRVKQELKINIYIGMENKYQLWDSFSEEDKRKIGTALNDKALRAVGYIPASEIKNKQ